MAKLGSSPTPLITTTSGGGCWLGKAKPCLSPSQLLSSLSFPHSALNGEFGVVVLWVNPCGYRSWIFGELMWVWCYVRTTCVWVMFRVNPCVG
uniref:Uncharacterized protein n=2 Tax=Fagus sylvatica TaxID=28930 RepID=A0A2N9HSQ8_FAGSY